MANHTFATNDKLFDGTKHADTVIRRVEVAQLPNTGALLVPHGIIGLIPAKVVDLRGVCTNGVSVRPLPFSDSTAINSIRLTIENDTENVRIATGVDYSTFSGVVWIEYMP